MSELHDKLNGKIAIDVGVVSDFIAIFCREQHGTEIKENFPLKDERLRQVLE